MAIAPVPERAREVASGDPWAGLRTLIWARLLVAALALPFGTLLRAEPAVAAWRLLAQAILAVGVVSGLAWLGTILRRGHRIQIYLNVAADIVLVTILAAMTGGHESPFALFYVLIVLTGGLQAGPWGGLGAAVCASLANLGLHPANPAGVPLLGALLPHPGMFAALLLALGVLAAALRRRAQDARASLDAAARELDRMRFDHDLILRHLTSGVLTLDGRGVVAYLNPAAEQVLGLDFERVRGRRAPEVMTGRLQPLADALIEVIERHTTQSRGELLLRTAGGRSLPLGISTNLLRHEQRVNGVVAVFTDLTEVREMEAQVRRNQTLAEVGALAAGIAHELRNGLSPINGSVECLQRELKLEGENAQLMDLISRECARLNRFVTDLLTYSRERPLVRQTLDLNENLADLCDDITRDPRRGTAVSVRFEPGEGAAATQVDREQLRQVWLNLARNALDAVGESGTVTVRWRPNGAERLAVEFEDDGPGIAPDDLPRVGQPFFTTKKGGTGLGLAIAQRIVERHGGSLSLVPAAPRGTIARVNLPGTVTAAARAA